MQVINFPHPTLRHVSKPLRRVDAELRKMVEQMFELMYEHKGIGLAANQVDLPYRLFVINPTGDRSSSEDEHVFINPVLSSPKGSATGEEGCLSIPSVYGEVRRAERITINAFNLQGEEFRGEVEDMFARVVQHETDHLDGKLFIDRISSTEALDIRGALQELELDFQSQRETGAIPDDAAIATRLAELEGLRT